MPSDRKRSGMQIERMSISDLTPDPANARTHDERNVDAVIGSLKLFGQQKPIVVGGDGRVVAGNATLKAAVALGWTEIDVVRTELVGADAMAYAMAYAIADNRSSELAAWDREVLATQIRGLDGGGFDVDALGWTPDELTLIAGAELTASDAADLIPEKPAKATTQRGDLWVMGDHRLLCADSAVEADVQFLVGGDPIHLVNTDPPYNVFVEPASNDLHTGGQRPARSGASWRQLDGQRARGAKPARKNPKAAAVQHAKGRRLESDFQSDEDFEKLLSAWFGNIAQVLLPGRAFYIRGGYANIKNYPAPLNAAGLYFSQAIIWVKGHPVITRKDFMGNHEWCFYGWREGAAHVFLGANNITDVWQVKKVNPASMIHLTEKPVELALRALQYSSRTGEHVLDLFGGSGSTLIAAEESGRKARLMEIDPLYCDVIVQRWETLTGQRAERQQGYYVADKAPTDKARKVKNTKKSKKSRR